METTTPKQKILFFGSGDFPVRTFRMLIANGYEIAGLVTSKDRVFFESERLSDIANANNIPVYVPRTTDEPELLQWLDEHPADIFCVISYKYLKSDVLSKAKTAFNVHASLLPFLRGANPITWAIMNNFINILNNVNEIDKFIEKHNFQLIKGLNSCVTMKQN